MNNQHAFPFVSHEVTSYGMTLRDYFAAKAMQALITNTDENSAFEADLWVGRLAYEIADAMMEKRNEQRS